MTVRRQRTMRFTGPPDAARAAIERVLAEDHRYRVLDHDGDRWVVRIRPAGWPLVLSTELTIEIAGTTAHEVTIEAATRSQLLVMGDVFGVYEAYLTGLEAALGRQGLGRAPT